MSALILGSIAVSVGVLLLAKWIRDVSRGFEFLDEGYKFLILQDPWKNLANSPFGFFLHPWYQLAGGDPGLYRFLGLSVLLVMGMAVGRAWLSAVDSRQPGWSWATLAAIVSGFLLVFSNGRRTPAYDYLVFIGAAVSWLGYFRIFGSKSHGVIPWIVLGLGLGLVALAKWSAFVPLTLVFLFLIQPWNNSQNRLGWIWIILTGGCLVAFLLFCAGAEAIRGIFWQNRLLAETLGTHGAGLLGYYVPTTANFFYRSLRAFAYGLPLLLILGWLQRQSPAKIQKIRPWVWLLPWAVLGAGFLFGLAKGGISSFSRVGSNIFAEQLWVLAAFLVTGKSDAWSRLGSCRAPMVGLLLTPFAIGIGTSSALGDYTGHGAVFFQLAGLFLWKSWIDRGLSAYLAAAFLWVATILNFARANAALDDPYRAKNSGLCDVDWKIPAGGRLLLDAERAEVVLATSRVLETAGFRPGDPLIAVGNLPGLVYLVGGWSPGTVWYYDTHPNAKAFLLRALQALPEPAKNSSWLLLRENSGLWPVKNEILSLLKRKGGKAYEIGPVPIEGETTRLYLWPPSDKSRF